MEWEGVPMGDEAGGSEPSTAQRQGEKGNVTKQARRISLGEHYIAPTHPMDGRQHDTGPRGVHGHGMSLMASKTFFFELMASKTYYVPLVYWKTGMGLCKR